MTQALVIVREEWRYWLRSHLALAVVALFVVVLISVNSLTAVRMQAEASEREHHQAEAEHTFLAQPDRHPHRMVHYGHYVFRTPVPLAAFDPGLDSVTGKTMFLEGHRQNSATFSASGASAGLGSLSWLTPAMVYQVFAPLLVIVLGHGAIIREREAGALAPLLAQGMSGRSLLAGKLLALFLFVLLLLVPLVSSVLLSLGRGESMLAAASLVGTYFLYLSVWASLTLLISSLLGTRSSAVATLAALWLILTLVLPAVAVNVASSVAPLAGKIETELAMLNELKDLSDGHSVSDSDFEQLRSNLLEEYGVDRVEELEVNIRGIVAQNAEEKLTQAMNAYADRRMEAEMQQAGLLAGHGWVTPLLAVAGASRALSGTDLEHHHRFLRQAEELRYEFVQGLNRVHAEQLSYMDDVNRNRDQESYDRTRMDASNWRLLDEFRFVQASAPARLATAGPSILMLVAWAAVLSVLLIWAGGRLKP